MSPESKESSAVRELVQNWAMAVRSRDLDTILAHHSPDMVMFDVPEPFQLIGLGGVPKNLGNILCQHQKGRVRH